MIFVFSKLTKPRVDCALDFFTTYALEVQDKLEEAKRIVADQKRQRVMLAKQLNKKKHIIQFIHKNHGTQGKDLAHCGSSTYAELVYGGMTTLLEKLKKIHSFGPSDCILDAGSVDVNVCSILWRSSTHLLALNIPLSAW